MPPPTKKRQRKPNKDKDIEAVLQLKDKWNLQTSLFIWDLIALKRGINGRGDPDHRLPPSRVHQKLDASISTLLNKLTGQYRELAQNSLTIVKKQEELADLLESRKAEKGKSHTPTANPDAAKKIGPVSMFGGLVPEPKAAAPEPDLVVEATNSLTRGWYSLKTPFSSTPGARLLEGILYKLLDVKNELEEMQDAAVSTGPDDINRLRNALSNFNVYVGSVSKQYKQYAKTTGLPTGPDLGSEYSAYDSKYDEYVREFHLASSISGMSGSYKHRFKELATAFKNAKNDIDKADLLAKIDMVYKQLLAHLRADFELSINKPWSTVSEIYSLGPRPIPKDMEGLFADDKLQTLAHNILTRLLKKKKMSLPFSDANAGIRLKLFQTLANARKNVMATMTSIESHELHVLPQSVVHLKGYNDEITRLVNDLVQAVGTQIVKEKKTK